jgi:hypothetical protein
MALTVRPEQQAQSLMIAKAAKATADGNNAPHGASSKSLARRG